MSKTAHKTPGVIRADEAYSIAEFARRSRLGEYAMKEARAAGLRVIPVGRKRFVLGRDWLDFLDKQAAKSAES